MRKIIEEQLIYSPKSKILINSWIISAVEVLGSGIVADDITISRTPDIKSTSLFTDGETDLPEEKKKILKDNLIEA